MALNESTYFSKEADRDYMSVSQFKNFQKCEATAIAQLNGEYIPERGRALILGSYVDEMLTGAKESQEKFVEENRAELFKKNGEPYADVAQADEAIIRIRFILMSLQLSMSIAPSTSPYPIGQTSCLSLLPQPMCCAKWHMV